MYRLSICIVNPGKRAGNEQNRKDKNIHIYERAINL
jgi:hypothetical protein